VKFILTEVTKLLYYYYYY